jgi:hypothetical protein
MSNQFFWAVAGTRNYIQVNKVIITDERSIRQETAKRTYVTENLKFE